jgi:hypothetical protein
MMAEREIRADYDADTIVVYQAYGAAIARPAVEQQRFVAPFSLERMTWIKPSFLWMMERSNWGQQPGQEHILAVRITRQGWDEALANAVLTAHDPRVYRDVDDWQAQLAAALVRVQWDPEHTLAGKALDARAIQVGLSRHIVARYVNEWTRAIRDITPLVRTIHTHVRGGHSDRARALVPRERVYAVDGASARRLGMG